MQPDDIGLLEWSFKGLVGVILTVGGWLWVRLMTAVSETKDSLSDHKLHVSENYAKKSELTPIYNKLDDMQNDLKILVGMKRERDQ